MPVVGGKTLLPGLSLNDHHSATDAHYDGGSLDVYTTTPGKLRCCPSHQVATLCERCLGERWCDAMAFNCVLSIRCIPLDGKTHV